MSSDVERSDGYEVFDSKTALVVVDVQNDFANPEGSLYVPDGDGIVPVVNDLIRRAGERRAFVVHTQDWHPKDTPHFRAHGGSWPEHCVKDTWGAQLHPDLEVGGPVVKKGTGRADGYSGFTVRDPQTGEEQPTELEGMLRERGVERVVVVGLAQDVCVKETALDGVRLGFETIVLADATRPVARRSGDGARAAAEMTKAGVEIR